MSIVANVVEVRDGAQLSSAVVGEGKGGRVRVEATETVIFSGTNPINDNPSGAFSGVEPQGKGNAGGVSIVANTVEVRDGAQLSSRTAGEGNAGTVRIEATDIIVFSGSDPFDGSPSGAFSQVAEGGQGSASGIRLVANAVEVLDGARLSSGTFGEGDAGTVTIEAGDTVVFSGFDPIDGSPSAAFSGVALEGRGNASGVRIVADTIEVREDAVLSSENQAISTPNEFSAGDVVLQANSIELSDGASITADTRGREGNIRLNSQATILRRGSRIQTNAEGNFPGGNIAIDTGVLAALENSDISANAEESFGGRVTIDAQGIFGTQFREQPTPDSDITATSALGPQFSGIVEINTPDIDATAGLTELPENPDIPRLARGCQAGGVGDARFVNTGRSGVPPNPYEPLSSDALVEDTQLPTSWQEDTSEPLVEAQGWTVNDRGQVVLISDSLPAHSNLPCFDR